MAHRQHLQPLGGEGASCTSCCPHRFSPPGGPQPPPVCQLPCRGGQEQRPLVACDSPTYTASSAAPLQDMLVPAAAPGVSEGPCQEHHRSSQHWECWHCVCELLTPLPCQICGTKLHARSPWEGLPIVVTRAQHQEPCLQQELSPEMSKRKEGPGHLLTSFNTLPAPGQS